METTLVRAVRTSKKAPAGNYPPRARANAVPGCALTAALAAMGGRWKLFVLYRLADGALHFAALRRSLPDMSAKVLAQQLREMQADGLVARESRGSVPEPVLYSLTTHGRSLLPVAEAIRRWGMAHQQSRLGSGEPDLAIDPRAACEAGIRGVAADASHGRDRCATTKSRRTPAVPARTGLT